MTDVQKWAVDLVTNMDQQILTLCGRAGTGTTQVALLKTCECFPGRAQAAAVTGKPASLFNGQTIHGMFQWGVYDKPHYGETPKMSCKMITFLQSLYDPTDDFVFE